MHFQFHFISAQMMLMVISMFAGIRGEDAGKIGCFKLGDDKNAAYIKLRVHGGSRQNSCVQLINCTESLIPTFNIEKLYKCKNQ